MIYGAIDIGNASWYTDLNTVFLGVGDVLGKYNWLITDSEVNSNHSIYEQLNTKPYYIKKNDEWVKLPSPEYAFLPGEDLMKLLGNGFCQWIWGVLSGFEKTIPLDRILSHPLPYADGYRGFWENPPTIQHPLADVEIVPWDGTLVLVISKNKEIVDRFRAAFPHSKDLSDYNR